MRQFIHGQGQNNLGFGLNDDDDDVPLIRPTASSFYTAAAQSDRLSYHSVLGKLSFVLLNTSLYVRELLVLIKYAIG